jgi:ATP:ADP antiporter, AAA family
VLAQALHRVARARPGEGRALALAFAYFFMLLCAYYLLRPLRDALAIGTGLEYLPWLYTGTFIVMLMLTPVFGALVSRVRKPLLLPITYAFFASNLLVFYLLFKLEADVRWVGAAFYIWLSVFNYFVVSVFWSFMADVFRDEEAKRLFGPISAGGGSGAILGPLLLQYLLPRIGVDAVVALAMVLLLATLPCIRALARWAEARHGRFVLPPEDPESRIGGRTLAGLLLVARSPYLLRIFTIIAVGSVTGLFMYNELLRLVGEHYPDLESRSQFFAQLDLAVNLASWLLQGFAVAWLIRRFELSGALVTIPIAALLSFVALAAAPLLLVLAAGQVVRRAGEFGIAKPSREILFTIVDAETKYKAKNFIDTAMQRGSDTVAIWVYVLMQAAGVGLVGYALISAVGMTCAIFISHRLGREFERRQSAGTSPVTAGPSSAE